MYLVFIALMSFAPNELVWYNEDGQTHSAGFSIDSLLAKSHIKPLTTLNEPIQYGGGSMTGQVSDLFRYMGVPAGLSNVLGDDVSVSNELTTEDAGMVSDSLFDKLLGLAGPSDVNSSSSTSQSGGETGKPKRRKTRKASTKGECGKQDKKRKARRTRRK
jgi:hypothetical protein